ncbi:MAG: PTH1 family peptidyl-tRNA hydrolase [Oceanicoccus sp.]|jgi:PTH1 family peptidyl-tRNA hydrolase
MKLICGLGNPGKKYQNTRHNMGFMVIDALAEGAGFKEKWNALVTEISLHGEKTLLIKPLTFMNLSGQAVAKFANFYKLESIDITIVYDDIDLPLGTLRSRDKGSAGTHNGMKSIIQELGTQEFPRLRLGIESRGESAPEQMDLASFVLAQFTKEESEIVEDSVSKAVDLIKKPLA